MQQTKSCKTCSHFFQHYVKLEKGYRSTYCGHCIHPRIKKRTADTKSCIHYKEKIAHMKKEK